MSSISISPQVDEALAELARRWPGFEQAINEAHPVWRDSLAQVAPDWAPRAALAVGWLDRAASALVSANATLKRNDREPSPYPKLLEKIEALRGEVSNPDKSRGVFDNWHLFRSVDRRPLEARLQSLMEDRNALEASQTERLRGLRDAMEVRELARVVVAGLSEVAPEVAFRLEEDERAAQEKMETSDPSTLSYQQAARSSRTLLRAKTAFQTLRMRFSSEFANPIAGLDALEEAIAQEEAMRARVDTSLGTLASQVAGLQIGQDLAPKVLEDPSAKRGFLARLGFREAARSGGSPETAKSLRVLASSTNISEKEWKALGRLLLDPAVGPSTRLGENKRLLDTLMETGVDQEVPASTYADTVLMLALSDGGEQLRKSSSRLVQAWCHRLAGVQDKILDLDWMDLDAEDYPHMDFGHPQGAAKIWLEARLPQRLPLPASLDFCKHLRAEFVEHGIDSDDWKTILTQAWAAASPKAIRDCMQRANLHEFMGEVQDLLPAAVRSALVAAQLNHNLAQGAPITRSMLQQVNRLTPQCAAQVAEKILLTQRHNPVAANAFNDPQWADTDETVIRALQQYAQLSSSLRKEEHWPADLAQFAFSRKASGLLHLLCSQLPEAKVGIEPGVAPSMHPLLMVMQMDGATELHSLSAPSKGTMKDRQEPQGKETSSTHPERWCSLLQAWKDVPATWRGQSQMWEPGVVGYPGATPLMIAAKSANFAWIRALRQAGVDLSLRDEQGNTASAHWVAGLAKTAGKRGLPRMLLLMEQEKWWALPELEAASFSKITILTEMLNMDRTGVDADCLASRDQETVRLMEKAGANDVMIAFAKMSMIDKKGWKHPSMIHGEFLVQQAGLMPSGVVAFRDRVDEVAQVSASASKLNDLVARKQKEAYEQSMKYMMEKHVMEKQMLFTKKIKPRL